MIKLFLIKLKKSRTTPPGIQAVEGSDSFKVVCLVGLFLTPHTFKITFPGEKQCLNYWNRISGPVRPVET